MIPSFFSDPFTIVYGFTLSGMAVYGLHRSQLARRYLKTKAFPPPTLSPLILSEEENAPYVLIQLPIFNESLVVKRLLESICLIQYPKNRLWIQVLDDSTDESATLVHQLVEYWIVQGVPISYHHRTHRVGFKAGALREGLALVPQAQLVAIFDADFIPSADFLLKTVPYFKSPLTHQPTASHQRVGVVQARWEHLNRERSLLTRAQAILLDGHFMIEHTARHRSGCFFNFNGTAGVWDRVCIEEAGGWEHDTITEDLDLSYRAQLKGWRFIFLNDVTAPAELPEDMGSFKTQQHRWAKGSFQVALKVLPHLLKSELPWRVKREGLMHLTSNLAYVLMIFWSLITPYALKERAASSWPQIFMWLDVMVFGSATISVIFFYGLSQKETAPDHWKSRISTLPAVLALGAGLAVNNTKAVIEALIGVQSPFVRTPKRGDHSLNELSNIADPIDECRRGRYQVPKNFTSWIELILSINFFYAAYLCITFQQWLSLPFMLLFGWGLAYVGLLSLRQRS